MVIWQILCSGSNLFVGTQFSTFSSYITRIKGYAAGQRHKGIFYSDRRYMGDIEKDSNEAAMDTTNSQLGGGEMFYFREPRNVWVEEDNQVRPRPWGVGLL